MAFSSLRPSLALYENLFSLSIEAVRDFIHNIPLMPKLRYVSLLYLVYLGYLEWRNVAYEVSKAVSLAVNSIMTLSH